ncbi:MAG: hypothetical protein AAFV53_14905 [Myxococcota bacterium]
MGYGVMAYSVSGEAIRSLDGSGNDKIRRAISGRFRRDIMRFNDNFDLSNERGADNMFEAIRHLIMGTDRPLPGYLYGYAYKFIVDFHGRFLDNGLFCPCNAITIEETIDPQMAALGLPMTLSDLIYQDALMSFPSPSDFPAYGFWSESTIKRAHPVFQGASALSEEMDAIRGWVAQAHSKGDVIVGFYH